MKKLIKCTALLIIAVLSIIPLLFIKANASINVDYSTYYPQMIVVFAPPPSTYGLADAVSYPLLSTTYTDSDGTFVVDIIQMRTTQYGDRYQLGQGGTPFNPAVYLHMDKLYCLHLYPQNNATTIDLYELNTTYDSQAGEISYSIGNLIKTLYSPYNLSGGDAASNIKYTVNYASLISVESTSTSNQWGQSTLNSIINGYFNYDIFNYEIIDAYDNGYDVGYDIGYDNGYIAGQSGETAISPFWNILTHIWTGIGDVLEIELVPHVPLGIFIAIPLFFGAVGFIFWIWKRGH